MGKKRKLKSREKKIKSIEFKVTPEKHCILKLPNIKDKDLPYVSVITPTRNRRFIFELAVYQFLNFIYPPEKLEWVVLDNGTEKIRDLIPDSINLKYISIDGTKKYSISDLRNNCIKYSSHDYIVYMDDDDYYPPESILARIKALIKYQPIGVECVGCTGIGCYNIFTNDSYNISNGDKYLSEASICHLKKFWEVRKFKKNVTGGEFKHFLRKRQNKIRHIPFQFVCTALNHHANTTDRGMKKLDDKLKIDKKDFSFVYMFNDDIKRIFQKVIENLY